jgi:hypothetical protein
MTEEKIKRILLRPASGLEVVGRRTENGLC